MSLFSGPEQHAANPPESWVVVKRARRWAVETADGVELDHAPTKMKAQDLKTGGFIARLYAQESRWYAGDTPEGWQPFKG